MFWIPRCKTDILDFVNGLNFVKLMLWIPRCKTDILDFVKSITSVLPSPKYFTKSKLSVLYLGIQNVSFTSTNPKHQFW